MDSPRTISFRVDCVPPTATAQQKGAFVCGGRVRFFTKAKVRKAENILAALLSPHAPSVPFDKPVTLTVSWTFPYRKSERKHIIKNKATVPHTTRPDLDNLEKSLLDVMTSLRFWTDDSLVSVKTTSKWRGATPGIAVEIGELPETIPF